MLRRVWILAVLTLGALGCSSSDGGGGVCDSPQCYDKCLCQNGDADTCALACGVATGGTGGGGGAGAMSGAGGAGAVAGAAGNPSCDDGSGWDPSWQSFECAVLDLTNQRRAQGASCGGVAYPPAGPLAAHPILTGTARAHATDMGDNNYFSHTNLQGQSSGDRIKAAGYVGSPIGENIAAGQDTPQEVVQGWMDSEGHCKNIMQPKYNYLGVGFYLAPSSKYKQYWVQNFGG